MRKAFFAQAEAEGKWQGLEEGMFSSRSELPAKYLSLLARENEASRSRGFCNGKKPIAERAGSDCD